MEPDANPELLHTFCQVAAAHLGPVRAFLTDPAGFLEDPERVLELLPQVEGGLAAAERAELGDLARMFRELRHLLRDVGERGAVSTEALHALLELRDPLLGLLGAAAQEPRPARDDLEALGWAVSRTPGLSPDAVDRLAAARIAKLEVLSSAPPRDVAAVTGLEEETCRHLVATVARIAEARKAVAGVRYPSEWAAVLAAARKELEQALSGPEGDVDAAALRTEAVLVEMGRRAEAEELRAEAPAAWPARVRELERELRKPTRAEVEARRRNGAPLSHLDLRGLDLSHLDLREADLSGSDLRDADLEGADLTGARLLHADLRGARLRSARLDGATCRHSRWAGADLAGASLRDADLRGADIGSALTEGADLSGALLPGARRAPEPKQEPEPTPVPGAAPPESRTPALRRRAPWVLAAAALGLAVAAAGWMAASRSPVEPVTAGPPSPEPEVALQPPGAAAESERAPNGPAARGAAKDAPAPGPAPVGPVGSSPTPVVPESPGGRPSETGSDRTAPAEGARSVSPGPRPAPAERDASPASPPKPPKPAGVAFADPALEACVRRALGQPDGPLAPALVARLRSLDCATPEGGDPDVQDLRGIEALAGLERLDLSFNAIADIGPLAGLRNLRELRLTGNRVRDISPIAWLPASCAIDLRQNPIADITPLLRRGDR